jgi:hypothetical protein
MAKFASEDWAICLYGNEGDEPELGQRLGIQYMKAMQETIVVKYGDLEYSFCQESMGLLAIAGVVWDAGLLMVDFLQTMQNKTMQNHVDLTFDLGNVLDVGCGTGVAGISALLTGAERVLFTDIVSLPCFRSNIEQLPNVMQSKHSFFAYKWDADTLPSALCGPTSVVSPTADSTVTVTYSGWDTVLCSDLLYEEKCHDALLCVLQRLTFKRAIFSYKKRHDVPEKVFFEKLGTWCRIRVVDSKSIELKNLPVKSHSGLYIVLVEPI